MFSNAALLFSYVTFVNELGAKNYPLLVFYISALTFFVYIFMFFAPKFRIRSYLGTITLLLGASILLVLTGKAQLMVIAFTAIAGLSDLVGNTICPMIIQSRFSPPKAAGIINRYFVAEITGKFVAAMFMVFLSKFISPDWILSLIIVNLVIHLITFKRGLLSDLSLADEAGTILGRAQACLSFFKSNSLFKTAISLILWYQSMKLFVEFSFFTSMKELFPNKNDFASFLGSYDFGMNVLSLVLVPSLSTYSVHRMGLSMGVAILPVALIFMGLLALFISIPWVVLGLMVVFLLSYRSFYRPISRQCMLPIPPKLRADLLVFVTIVTALANMGLSQLVTLFSNYLDRDLSIFVSIFLAMGLLRFTNRLDSYYLKNLWTMLKDSSSRHRANDWNDSLDLIQESSEFNDLLDSGDDNESSGFSDQAQEIHSLSRDLVSVRDPKLVEQNCQKLSEFYLKPLNSDATERLTQTLAECSPPTRENIKAWLLENGDPNHLLTSPSFSRLEAANRFLQDQDLTRINLATRTNIEEYLQRVFASDQFCDLQKVRHLLQLDAHLVQDIFELLNGVRFSQVNPYIFECIDDGGVFNFRWLLEQLECLSYEKGLLLRYIISSLGKHFLVEIDEFIGQKLSHLTSQGVVIDLFHPKANKSYEAFASCLYLVELSFKPKAVSQPIRASIGQLLNRESKDRDILIDLHRRIIRKCHYNTQFKKLLQR